LETENKYKYTKAYFKIKDLIMNNPHEDVFVIRGGQGASKTISIIELIIQSLLSTEKEASILSSELSKMKRTVIRDYKKVAKDWGVLKEREFNRSESKHEYFNGSYLDFLGADVTDLGKGFRRDILYINEADKMDIDTAVHFISRADLTIIDYNPDSLFWGDDYITENNCLTLTYLDNEYLSKSEIKSILDYKQRGFYNSDLPLDELFEDSNIKNSYWANKWRVYGLGLIGSLEGVIFNNWKIVDNVPKAARKIGRGGDFGYTNDPTAITDIYKYNNVRILDELVYQKGLSNKQIAKQIPDKLPVYFDSAEPKSIAEIKNYGVRAIGASKGKDSVNYGIQIMQEQEYWVTRRSKNIINELTKYTWKKDKRTNQKLNVPIDDFNHAIDGIRYHEMETLKPKKKSSIRIRV
jgi:phage terminase large subunit